MRLRLRIRAQLRASHRAELDTLVVGKSSRDGLSLGRFDGVDCRPDTPHDSGFDSRALQPR